jgi:hypothetical protein
LVATLAGCGGAERSSEGNIVSGGDLNVFQVRVGDCFEDPPGILDADNLEVEEIEAVPCSEPHDNEAYHDFSLGPGPWPGEVAIFGEADEECFAKFESYVARDYQESRLEFSYFFPTEQSWGGGDREVVCYLFDVNLEKLSGSMRNSGE